MSRYVDATLVEDIGGLFTQRLEQRPKLGFNLIGYCFSRLAARGKSGHSSIEDHVPVVTNRWTATRPIRWIVGLRDPGVAQTLPHGAHEADQRAKGGRMNTVNSWI